MGKHLEQALPSVYTLQCLIGNNNKAAGEEVVDITGGWANPHLFL